MRAGLFCDPKYENGRRTERINFVSPSPAREKEEEERENKAKRKETKAKKKDGKNLRRLR